MKKDYYVIVISYYKCLCLYMTYSPTITAITTVENDDNNKGMMETVEQMMPLNVIDTCVELSSWMSAVYRAIRGWDTTFMKFS